MNKNEIIELLNDWNFWADTPDTGIERREYISRLRGMLESDQIIVITGVRRSGKSFLMKQLAESLIVKDGIPRNEILIINFEDPRFSDLNAQLLQRIYEVYLEFMHPDNTPYIFLDEVQEVENWEKWVRTTQELKKARVIISGSNARLLSRELSTLLTGRHIDMTVFPLSFKEYLLFNNLTIRNSLDLVSRKVEINRSLRQYLELGAFPDVVLHKRKEEILLSYYEDIIYKDLIRRYRVRKPESLKSLARYYLSNISNLTTYSATAKFLNITVNTIEKYSGYLETAYLNYFLKRHSFKVKEQEKSPRKVYTVDSGLANLIGFRFSENVGRTAENAVFLELKRRQANIMDSELFYWKDEHHREVDFALQVGTKIEELIQVCWKLSSPQVNKRESRSLIKALNIFNLDRGLIITEEDEGEEEIKGKQIAYIPLWKWLLGTIGDNVEV